MIAIIDYGAGNLSSVQKALNFLGADNRITADPAEILAADRVILPGVGAFGDAMARWAGTEGAPHRLERCATDANKRHFSRRCPE